jgi:hypothetical protein
MGAESPMPRLRPLIRSQSPIAEYDQRTAFTDAMIAPPYADDASLEFTAGDLPPPTLREGETSAGQAAALAVDTPTKGAPRAEASEITHHASSERRGQASVAGASAMAPGDTHEAGQSERIPAVPSMEEPRTNIPMVHPAEGSTSAKHRPKDGSGTRVSAKASLHSAEALPTESAPAAVPGRAPSTGEGTARPGPAAAPETGEAGRSGSGEARRAWSEQVSPAGFAVPAVVAGAAGSGALESGPRVIIDRLDIEIVPPAAAAPKENGDRKATVSRPRAPVSQIGPLSQTTASRHYLSLRYG